MPKLTAHKSVKALCLVAIVSGLGCAHTPPKELVDARAAYKQASSGVASNAAWAAFVVRRLVRRTGASAASAASALSLVAVVSALAPVSVVTASVTG